MDDGDAVIEMDVLPPRWAEISDEVTEHLETIAKQSHALERLHQKHVLPGFNDEEAKKAEEDEIDSLTRSITRAFHDCHKCITRIEQIVREGKSSPQGLTSAEETMARNIQVSLAAKVQEASAGFRKKQSAYLKSKDPFSDQTSRIARAVPDVCHHVSLTTYLCNRAPRHVRSGTFQHTTRRRFFVVSTVRSVIIRSRPISSRVRVRQILQRLCSTTATASVLAAL